MVSAVLFFVTVEILYENTKLEIIVVNLHLIYVLVYLFAIAHDNGVL